MPAKKKILVGGSIAGLVLSLALPVSQSGGLSTSSEVTAGVRPKFSKPWHVDKNKTGKETVKSYPLPDHLKEGYTGEMPADPGAPPSEVMLELQKVYEQNGEEAPQMGGGEVPVQEAGLRRERERDEQKVREEKSGNAFTRFFSRLTGRENKKATVKSYPLPEQTAKPDLSLPESEPQENIAERQPASPPAKLKQAPMIALPSPDNAPVAEVIIPPQPQPNLLPGMDFDKSEAIKPMVTKGLESSKSKDPFPLPPLPDGFEKKQEKTVQAEPEPAAKPNEGQFTLPPLPGFDDASAPQTAEVESMPATETETAKAHPLSEVAESPAEPMSSEPAQPEQLQAEAAPAVEATPEPMPEVAAEATAEEDLMTEALSVPQVAAAEPEVETEPAAGPEVEAETKSAELTQAPKARPSGEVANKLPLAPSSTVGKRWENRGSDMVQDRGAEESRLPASGWRSRNNGDVSREPNTLNIPAEARPAELPKPRVAESNPHADKYRRIAERGDRTGFKGFCPVALKDFQELVDASPEFRAEFEGQVYYFASQTHLNYFQADPLRYVPAQGGIDLVKYLEEGQSEPGRLDYAVWYQDRLFLFASPTTLETFRAEPGRFIK